MSVLCPTSLQQENIRIAVSRLSCLALSIKSLIWKCQCKMTKPYFRNAVGLYVQISSYNSSKIRFSTNFFYQHFQKKPNRDLISQPQVTVGSRRPTKRRARPPTVALRSVARDQCFPALLTQSVSVFVVPFVAPAAIVCVMSAHVDRVHVYMSRIGVVCGVCA